MDAKKHHAAISGAGCPMWIVALSLSILVTPAFAAPRHRMMQRIERPQAQTHYDATLSRGAWGASSAQRFTPIRDAPRHASDPLPMPNPPPPGIPGGSPGPTTDAVRIPNPPSPGIPGGSPGPAGNGVVGNPGFMPNPFGSPGLESGSAKTPPPIPAITGARPGAIDTTGTSLNSAAPPGGH